VGLAVVALLLAVQTPVAASIAGFYLDFSKSVAGGQHVVNVLLVDFRGYDTMGEITVLAVVAVAVYALLRLRGRAVASIEADEGED
jgi:multisubunit Na+/H+ antiporter MnhB subunit